VAIDLIVLQMFLKELALKSPWTAEATCKSAAALAILCSQRKLLEAQHGKRGSLNVSTVNPREAKKGEPNMQGAWT